MIDPAAPPYMESSKASIEGFEIDFCEGRHYFPSNDGDGDECRCSDDNDGWSCGVATGDSGGDGECSVDDGDGGGGTDTGAVVVSGEV